MNLPMLGAPEAPLMLENIPLLSDEVRALAAEREAVILTHNYQLPEIQDVADCVGDSLGLSQRAAAADAETIVFCGVQFMAETASVLCPDKRAHPRSRRRLLARHSITAAQLRDWKARHPGAVVVMYVNTTVDFKAETDYCCTSANAVEVVRHIYAEHGDETEILSGGPTCSSAPTWRRRLGARCTCGTGNATCTPGKRPKVLLCRPRGSLKQTAALPANQ